jgi:hypothetical protein
VIQLGSYDAGITPAARDAYLKQVAAISRVPVEQIADGADKLSLVPFALDAQQPMTVAEIQRALISRGFFPGGDVDGICGYRTLSAMRLFQEYVRSVEKLPSVPDGRFGAGSQQHLKRWLDGNRTMEWAPTIERWKAGTLGQTEYTDWLALLERVKAKYASAPTRMLQMVNAFTGTTDTRRVADWDFKPSHIHLVGIRRTEKTNKFDDIFILLIKGLVFKFQGSTEPGATDNPKGLPFLVQGQHDYHFGWHKKQYLALRPLHLDKGVLVVRSKNDARVDDADLDKGLEANATINVHWGGKGLKFDVKTWSEGCQVINGSAYLDPNNQLVDCSAFAAVNNSEVSSNRAKTRGAYNVLLDLVTALGNDISGATVKYMLLVEDDLGLRPSLAATLADARTKAVRFIG